VCVCVRRTHARRLRTVERTSRAKAERRRVHYPSNGPAEKNYAVIIAIPRLLSRYLRVVRLPSRLTGFQLSELLPAEQRGSQLA